MQASPGLEIRDKWLKKKTFQRQKQVEKKEMTIEELKLHILDDIRLKIRIDHDNGKSSKKSKYDGGVDSD